MRFVLVVENVVSKSLVSRCEFVVAVDVDVVGETSVGKVDDSLDGGGGGGGGDNGVSLLSSMRRLKLGVIRDTL